MGSTRQPHPLYHSTFPLPSSNLADTALASFLPPQSPSLSLFCSGAPIRRRSSDPRPVRGQAAAAHGGSGLPQAWRSRRGSRGPRRGGTCRHPPPSALPLPTPSLCWRSSSSSSSRQRREGGGAPLPLPDDRLAELTKRRAAAVCEPQSQLAWRSELRWWRRGAPRQGCNGAGHALRRRSRAVDIANVID
jgi:hypothetical protein